jgi:UDP-N-acetylglucosamine--N-acetylmuramyl-(pentapeptide) pyrophosphoryl-undecaprenol N-acetylglucosamine transferase
VLHLAGAGGDAFVREALAAAGVRAWVAPFSDQMGTLYATADLVLSRAGGTTLAELTVAGRPSVLVPYPHHADRHQERNAAALVDAGAARLVCEEDLTPERFEREVLDLVKDRERRTAMGEAAAGLGVPDAAERVAEWAQELVETKA